jgi:hypothetical protein
MERNRTKAAGMMTGRRPAGCFPVFAKHADRHGAGSAAPCTRIKSLFLPARVDLLAPSAFIHQERLNPVFIPEARTNCILFSFSDGPRSRYSNLKYPRTRSITLP